MKKTFENFYLQLMFRTIEIITCFFIIAGVIKHW